MFGVYSFLDGGLIHPSTSLFSGMVSNTIFLSLIFLSCLCFCRSADCPKGQLSLPANRQAGSMRYTIFLSFIFLSCLCFSL